MITRVLLLACLTVALTQEAPPVKIHLYYESLCPYSIDFVINQLYPTWTILRDIMQVELFPFGNASYEPDGEGWKFKCQHGEGECHGNMILACAKDHFKDINLEMEFVNCLLSSDYPPNAGATCAASVGADWGPLDQCVNSLEGQNLLHDVALQQEQLDPPLYFVPWIIVNDVFSEEQVAECQTDLKKVVCELYTGPPPEPCANLEPVHRPAARRVTVA
ncbi:gamma-interferon-inducible lysosomal thiol reductase-like [Panulirus ornatus]|uniref:gamma-interferon-inducible lysosomal thiol reductase-like n=1 Tax=Panulirus ornatus TaxID=150431 RepID=UPI003A8A3282